MEIENENENENQPITFKETAIECVDRLRRELAELKRENEHLTRDRNVFRNSTLARREEAFAAFGKMPFLLDWVESIAEDVLKLRSEDYLDQQDVDNSIEEFIGDSDLISQSEIESLIEFSIDEAKEEAQTIATDSIQEMIDESIRGIELVTEISY